MDQKLSVVECWKSLRELESFLGKFQAANPDESAYYSGARGYLGEMIEGLQSDPVDFERAIMYNQALVAAYLQPASEFYPDEWVGRYYLVFDSILYYYYVSTGDIVE